MIHKINNLRFCLFSRKQDGDRRHRQRHKSAGELNGSTTDAKLRRARTASSSSGIHLHANNNDTKRRPKRASEEDHDHDVDDNTEDDEPSTRKSTRKASVASVVALSPSSRKRRSELDKLLEAGSSSFHFETAREATTRINGENLGPIHVDVDSGSGNKTKNEPADEEASESEVEEVFEPAAKKLKRNSLTEKAAEKPGRKPDRLLQQAHSSASSSSSSSGSSTSSAAVEEKPPPSPPKKRGVVESLKKKLKPAAATAPARKGRPPKFGRKRGSRNDEASRVRDEEEERLAVLEKYLPSDLFEEIEVQLADLDGSEVDVEAMQFSFERTPFRESW